MNTKSANDNRTTSFSQFLLWFGAAVSIAEIQTGALLSPLGLKKGALAILIGHLIGAVILYLAGVIGAERRLPSIESTRISFGKYGSFGFSVLNVLQLLGWTAIMILNAAIAMNAISDKLFHIQNQGLWCVLIGVFICIWILVGVKNLSVVNIVVVGILFLLSIVLGYISFHGGLGGKTVEGAMSFGTGVELNVTMALSWLPLIGDYTRTVKRVKSGTVGSVFGYISGSIFMFMIGLGSAIYRGTTDIATILIPAGLTFAALFIVVFSTVTTTFLDAYSAGVSIVNVNGKINEKGAALLICILGIVLAIFIPISQYVNFLYFIGSVFAPLFAILLTDYFIIGKKAADSKNMYYIKNSVIWVIGVIFYQILLPYQSPVGITLPVMVVISVVCILINGGKLKWIKK
ncbi:MAG: putative hydroxymethylpyrimidine transporter CytX [Clostridiales bacterium]|nr:putative hydroxymethylpyrimidine transporter CytX [Clostridiales bacterium]